MASPTPSSAPGPAVIEAVDVTKRYGHDVVVDRVSLSVERGATICIIGPSGAGKSTFLRCLNQLESLDGGMVYLDDEPLGYEQHGHVLRPKSSRKLRVQRRSIGMVFQNFNLFGHMTALQNVMEGPVGVKGMPRKDGKALALGLLARFGLADKADAYPSALSGGQQQRVAIARALAMEPKVVLLDEPTSALDPELVNEVLDAIRILRATGLTLVIVTHEIAFARECADRIVFMDCGVIVEQGLAAEILNAPKCERTKAFLSKVL
jgi:polar amino acid transport system ATP-binding protein